MERILLKNARLIDGKSDEPVDGVNILLVGDKIEEISTGDIPGSGAEIIDLDGATVIPGLFDSHAHLAWDALQDIQLQSQNDSNELAAMKCTLNMRRYLETGVTTIRDLGVHWHGVESRNAVLAGTVPGPRILASGPPITTTGGHCWWCGVEADGEDHIRQTVRNLAKGGVDLVKVIATQASLGSYLFPGSASTPNPAFTDQELHALISESHNLGRKVTSHATTPEGAAQVVAAGIDCVEHGTDFTDETIEMMKQKGVFVVPTLSASWMQANYGHQIGIPEAEIQKRKDMVADPTRARGVARAAQAGVKIAVGTDQGSPCTPPASLITEMFLHLENDIAPDAMTVIRNATASAAELAGIDAFVGTIEEDKIADLVVTAKDPLDNIRNLHSPRMVFQAGRKVVENGSLVAESPFFFTDA